MELCVMTPGDIKMPLLFADNLGSLPMVWIILKTLNRGAIVT